MPPSTPSPSLPPPPVRRAKKPQAPSQGNNILTVAVVVVGIVLAGVILSMWPDGSNAGSSNSALNSFFDKAGVALNGAKVLCGATCGLVATRPIQQGEVVVTVPGEFIIEPRGIMESPIGQLMATDNFTIIKKHGGEKFGAAFGNVFAYTFFLAIHRRDPASKYRAWLDALPDATQMGGAIFWDPSMDRCVDQPVAQEGESLRAIVAAGADCAAELCSTEPGVCPHGAPTLEDMKWAVGTYLHRNYQDQAIILGADFSRVDNARAGLTPQFDQEHNTLKMVAGASYRKGESINVNFARGSGTLLASQGWFDESSSGVDSRIRMQETGDTLMQKFCVEKHGELLFTTAGYPRDALVSCIGVLVASPEHRKDFRKNLKSNKQLRSWIWGNLTGLITNTLSSSGLSAITQDAQPQCFADTPLAQSMTKYRKFTLATLEANLRYAQKKFEQLDPEEAERIADAKRFTEHRGSSATAGLDESDS